MLIYNTPGTFLARGMGCGMLTPCLLSFVICHCHSCTPICHNGGLVKPELCNEQVKDAS